MIEFYKMELLQDSDILNLFNDDEEIKLEHFTPNALEKLLENIDEIIVSEKEEFLRNDLMNAGRIKSIENPFTWLYPLFKEKIHNENFNLLTTKMHEYLKSIEIANIGIDSSSRRFRFEVQLKDSLSKILLLIDDEDILIEKKSVLIVAGFIAYAYMLRQLADYDSLFEVKASFTEIIKWTVATSDVLNFIGEYIKEEMSNEKSSIQKLEAESSIKILENPDINYNAVFMTITGIIVTESFNLVELIQKLYSSKGYKMINHNGEHTKLNNESDDVIISKVLYGTQLECFITFSIQGLFRIDVIPKSSIYESSFVRRVNPFYLEELIVSQMIEKDIIFKISSDVNIVIGVPTTSLSSEFSYYELVTSIHESNSRRIDINIQRYLDSFSDELSTTNIFVNPHIYFSRSISKNGIKTAIKNRFRRLISPITYYRRNAKIMESIQDGTITEVHNILFHNNEMDEEIKQELQQYLNAEYPGVNFNYDYILLAENEIMEVIEGNIELLRAKIIACRENLLLKPQKIDEVQSGDDFNLLISEDIEEEELEVINK